MRYGHNQIHFRVLTWYLIFTTLLLLTGCATTTSKKDGPPPFYVDETKIPNAKPKPEKLAKFGNMSIYRVWGREYHVLKSAKNYHEQGIASWYGTKFHKLRTSSGERYDMLAMTAAHKTLPLPTYVKVTNLKNGNQVIVKVNDRGPFSGERLIDLSYVAAKKLGMIGHGTTHVDVRAINTDEMYSEHPTLVAQNNIHHSFSHHGSPVFLQVGAFKNKLYAEKLRNRLQPLICSHIEITHLSHANKLYRVKIGPILDIAEADHIKKKLRAIGLTAHHSKV